LNHKGLVAYYQADYEQALASFQQALALWQGLGHQISQGIVLAYLGQVYYDMGQLQAARQSYHQALALHRTVGDRAGEALTRYGLAKIERSLGNYPAAAQLFEEALTFYQSIGDRYQEAYCLYDLGFLQARQANYKTALIFLEESVALLKELDAPWWALVKALIYYSWTLQEAGQLEKAQEVIVEALETERDTQQRVAMVEDTLLWGRVALALADLDLAVRCARQVLHFIERQGTQGIEHPVMVYLTCYRILQASGHPNEAETVLAQGRQYLNRQANQIEDPLLREKYLSQIPENREILTISR
jgi:tetratricopeptide (TPR) repeat protein